MCCVCEWNSVGGLVVWAADSVKIVVCDVCLGAGIGEDWINFSSDMKSVRSRNMYQHSTADFF